MDSLAIGIDLGTSNSCAAICKDDRVEIIPNEHKSYVMPSWVTFTPDGVLVGHEAKEKSHLYVTNSIYEFKRLMGEKYSSEKIQNSIKSVPYHLVNANGIPKIKIDYNGSNQQYSPEELSSYILAKLKDITEKYVEKSVNRVVVTVPAYFNDYQRQATKNAAIIAGFKTVNIINEPTAAALAFSHHNVKCYKRNVLVYDFGGGTFDVSVVSVGRGKCIVKATKGDSHLGGTDIDNNLLNHIKKDFKNQYGTEMIETEVDIRRLKNKCENVKQILSGEKLSTEIDMSRLSGKEYFTMITKSEFDQLNQDIFDRTLNTTIACLNDSGLAKDQIDEVVLVGGSSRILKVQNMLKDYFGESKISHGINPDEAVAYGAAIHASNLVGDKSEINDVNSVSLGIELLNKKFDIIIPKNTPVPETKTRNYCTISNNVSINIYQGEASLAKDNFKIGSFVLNNVDYSKIDVTFEIDAEGILKVTAVSSTDEYNKKGIIIDVLDMGLNQKEIDYRTVEIEQHRENEITRRKFDESKWELEILCEVVAENARTKGDKSEILDQCADITNWLQNITIADKEQMETKRCTLQNYFYGSLK